MGKVLLLIAGLTAVLGHYHDTSAQTCPECGSGRSTEQWGVAGVPLTPEFAEVGRSHACKDLFDANHEHRWVFWTSSRSALYGGYIACGRVPRNRFLLEYEKDPQFRAFVQGKIRGGKLARTQAAALAALPKPPRPTGGGCPKNGPVAPVKQPPRDPVREKLEDLGRALFAEHFGKDDAEWFFW